MGKISQSDAFQTARKIAIPYEKKITDAKKALQIKMAAIYQSNIPAEVMKIFGKFPEYIKTQSYIYPKGHGFTGKDSISFGCALPSGANNPTLSAIEAKELRKLFDAVTDLEDERDSLIDRIQNTILNLGTHAKVKEFLPEAYALLPGANNNTGLAVPIAPLREEIKKLTAKETA